MFKDCCELLTNCFGRSPSPETAEAAGSREHLDHASPTDALFPAQSQQSFISQYSGSGMASTPGGQSLNPPSLEQTPQSMASQAAAVTSNSQDSPAALHLDCFPRIVKPMESNGAILPNNAVLDHQSPIYLSEEHSTPAEEVPCIISAILDGLTGVAPHKHASTAQINSSDNFEKIEQYARKLLPSNQNGKVYLRHGTFTITHNNRSDNPESFSDPLNGPEDWTPCCATLSAPYSDTVFSIDLNFGIVPVYHHEKDKGYANYVEVTLHDKMKRFGSEENPDRMYIPQVDFDAIITKCAIEMVVNEQDADMPWASLTVDSERQSAKEKFVDKVFREARKLFAIYVYLDLSMRSLMVLLSKGATDKEPPSIDSGWNSLPGDRRKFDDLIKKQSWFKTFHFGNKESGQHHVVPEGTTVPISFGERLGDGAYSVVWEAEIDPCHQSFKKYRKSKFAVKVFKSQASRKLFFEKEHKMLVELNTQPHEHILTHITAWSQGKECYILFPLARMNLRRFLKEKQPEADSKITLWLLGQMMGLADAVKLIHNLDDSIDKQSIGTRLQVPNIADKKEKKQGYHHDLKPENMLLFYPGNDYTEGSLKISDFGMGKVNRVPEGSQIVSKRTRTLSGTWTYESPDYEMHQKTGRPHDMWALGCVLLELLCWLFVAPQKGGKSFQTDRRAAMSSTDSEIFSDSYYYMANKNGEKVPKLKEVVLKWMDAIEANPCCKDEFFIILQLIRKPGGLLEPDMDTRMKAETLHKELKDILQSATDRLDAAPSHYTGNVAQASKVSADTVDELLSPTHTPIISRQATGLTPQAEPPAKPTITDLPEITFQDPG